MNTTRDEMYLDFYFLDSKDAIEKEFEKYKVKRIKDKIKMLEDVMGVEKTYNSFVNKVSDKTEYQARLELFLDGTWRMI